MGKFRNGYVQRIIFVEPVSSKSFGNSFSFNGPIPPQNVALPQYRRSIEICYYEY